MKLVRFANRVPLLYQQGACATTKAVAGVSWKSYGLEQSSGSLPRGPAIVVVHMASVWVPFTSEGKEAVASYPDIIKEVKLALQECGRKLQLYIGRKRKAALEKEREETFKKYAGEVATAISSLTGKPAEDIRKKLIKIAEKSIIELKNGLSSSKGVDAVSEPKTEEKEEKSEASADVKEKEGAKEEK